MTTYQDLEREAAEHNARVAEYRAARKAQLEARPDCEGCGTRKVTQTVLPGMTGQTDLCQTCYRKVRHATSQPMLYPVAWHKISKDQVIKIATSSRRAA